jgi:hypothetical protein
MDLEVLVKNFCKKTKTAGMPWIQIVKKFLKENPTVSQDDFELCMLRQGKRIAEMMKNLCVKSDETGETYEEIRKSYGISRTFWDVCIGHEPPTIRRRSYQRRQSKIYLNVFQYPADDYSKEAKDLLTRFVESLPLPLEIIECQNPNIIEIRQVR